MTHKPVSRLEAIWQFCSHHQSLIQRSTVCGCFYCRKIFTPDKITVWLNDESTAMCPYCGIDSVLPEVPLYTLNDELLAQMHEYWFTGKYKDEIVPE